MRNSMSANTLFLLGIVALCKILNAVTENKTVLMIAHRMKSIQKAVKIIATENGMIKQEGTHDELILQNGIYKRFAKEKIKSSSWAVR